MSSQSWFISGANRGIGLEFVEQLSRRPNTIVFAGARIPSKATALTRLASENPNIHIVQLSSTSVADAAAAAKTVEKITGGLDVVIANAGIANNWQSVTEIDIDSLQEHYAVNVAGPIILFKALYPLLLKRQTRKFITVSTFAASITELLPVPSTVYAGSKIALNLFTKRVHAELVGEGFVAIPISPGAVDTDMGKAAAPTFGREKMPVSPEDSVEGMLRVIDHATVADGGRFWSYDGAELVW